VCKGTHLDNGYPAIKEIVPNQGGQGLGPCFKCVMNGHLARQCPNKLSATEEAQEAQDVVLGMFLASSHPVIVLFDSGASHSFISSSLVVKHQLPITIMK
jgi:hypothetical protein